MGRRPLDIRWLRADERPLLDRFVADRNRPGGQLCLHLADRPEDVSADLDELEPLTAACLVAVDPVTGEWRGTIAWEVGGPGGDRVWLFGPWTSQIEEDEQVTMIEAALARLPAEVCRIDNFVALDFAAGLAAHARLGFDPRRTVHVMRATAHRPVPSPVPIGAVDGSSVDDRARVEALHELAFPGTHTAVEQMLSTAGGRLWCARDGQIVGYVYAVRPEALPEGRIEYVAVAPEARGRGIGRALLATAVEWLFAEGAPEVFLTVDADNERALGVYRAAGFETWRSGRALTIYRAAP